MPGGETRAVWDKSMVSWWQVQAGWGGVTWSSKLVVKPGPNEEFPQPHKLPAAAEKDRGACPRPGAPGTAGLLWPHVACPCPQDRS